MIFEATNEKLYNNADSFAIAFDAAWNNTDIEGYKDKKVEDKIQITFEKIKTHPFLIENPTQAKNIALFRIKLLGLS